MNLNNKIPIIFDRKFILRPIKEDDYLDYYSIGASFSNTEFLTWGPFWNLSEAKMMIDMFYLSNRDVPAFAIEDRRSGIMIGIIEFHTYNSMQNSAEVGFILHEDFQHQGIMRQALGYLIEFGFNTLGLTKIIIAHVDLNIASKKLIEYYGFHYEYTSFGGFVRKDNGELRDIIYYSLYKYEYERGM